MWLAGRAPVQDLNIPQYPKTGAVTPVGLGQNMTSDNYVLSNVNLATVTHKLNTLPETPNVWAGSDITQEQLAFAERINSTVTPPNSTVTSPVVTVTPSSPTGSLDSPTAHAAEIASRSGTVTPTQTVITPVTEPVTPVTETVNPVKQTVNTPVIQPVASTSSASQSTPVLRQSIATTDLINEPLLNDKLYKIKLLMLKDSVSDSVKEVKLRGFLDEVLFKSQYHPNPSQFRSKYVLEFTRDQFTGAYHDFPNLTPRDYINGADIPFNTYYPIDHSLPPDQLKEYCINIIKKILKFWILMYNTDLK